MRRERASKRGQWLSLLLAGVVGFLLGDWHATDVRSRALSLSPSQNVALRFPEVKADAAVTVPATDTPAATPSPMVLGDAQFTLLSPAPMVPPRVPQPAPQAPAQEVAPEAAMAAPAPKVAPRPAPAARQPRAEQQSALDGASRHANRPRFVLNDAQIAGIKSRLRLTPDQQRMWPAVEAALRTIAYAKARDAQRRGVPAGAGDVASLNPDSVEVQGLKSAAVPLIMSFSEEQKSEVRNLAHGMGLDKLAAEF